MPLIKDTQSSRKFHTHPAIDQTAIDVQRIAHMLYSESKEFHYLSLRVLMDNSAKIMAMIQKRTVTFDSAHPFNSK